MASCFFVPVVRQYIMMAVHAGGSPFMSEERGRDRGPTIRPENIPSDLKVSLQASPSKGSTIFPQCQEPEAFAFGRLSTPRLQQ
jgi:hypothetical protein